MFKKVNPYNGAGFEYESESCTAAGKFEFIGENLNEASMNGSLRKDDQIYTFSAKRDSSGNTSIYNVPDAILKDVSVEVATIIGLIKQSNASEE